MAALLPLLQEILPMLMPGPVQIVRAEDVGTGEEEGDDDDDDDEKEVEEGDSGEEEDKGETGRTGIRRRSAEGDMAREQPSPRRDEERETGSDEAGRGEEHIPPRPRSPGVPSGSSTGRHRTRNYPRGGVSLRDAVVNKSSTLCASVLTVKPGCSTVIFHNGEQESIIYAVSGDAVLATLPEEEEEDDGDDGDDDPPLASKADPTSHAIRPGDFAMIPAWTEHQVRNVGVADGAGRPAADVVWVVVRNGAAPTVVPLQAWGGEQMAFD